VPITPPIGISIAKIDAGIGRRRISGGNPWRSRMKKYVKPKLTVLGLLRLLTKYSYEKAVFERHDWVR
jgi:hypothetical protein